VQNAIRQILFETQQQQEKMLIETQNRHLAIEQAQKQQLQKYIEGLDQIKARTLAELEKELQMQQSIILNSAKQKIDQLNEEANRQKMDVLKEAQEQVKHDIGNITDQVAVLGQQEAQNCLQSQTTTVITTQSQTSGETSTTAVAEVQAVPVVSEVPTVPVVSDLLPVPVVSEVPTVPVVSDLPPVPIVSEVPTFPAVAEAVHDEVVPVVTEVPVQDNVNF